MTSQFNSSILLSYKIKKAKLNNNNNMNITIGNYRIKRADDLNLVVENFRTPALSKNPKIAEKQSHEKKWHFMGYCDKPELALNKIVTHSLVNEEIEGASNFMEKIVELRREIKDAVSQIQT